MKEIETMRQMAISAVYESTLKTGCSPSIFAAIKNSINQRFENYKANMVRLEGTEENGCMQPEAPKGRWPMVTDTPWDNVSSALNLFYVKDGWTWVRGGGPSPDYADISLNDYVRMIARDHSLEIAKSSNEDEISIEMAELLFDGTDTVEGIIATLYTAGWAFAELRERLKHYEELEAQDRFVELPCAVGQDVVFCNMGFSNEICPATVVGVEINGHTPQCPVWLRIEYTSQVIGKHEYFCRADMMLGKTVFLSSVDAEAALKRQNGDDNETN